MGEGHIQKFINSLQLRLAMSLLVFASIPVISYGALKAFSSLGETGLWMAASAITLFAAIIFGIALGNMLAKPTEYLARTILHLSPSEHLIKPPNLDELHFGRNLTQTLARQIYDFASVAKNSDTTKESMPRALFDQLPVAIIGIDESYKISVANKRALSVVKQENLLGQNLNDSLVFMTEDESSIDNWLKSASEKSLIEFKIWQKVALKNNEGLALGYFDVAISFNKHSSSGVEALLALYDHSEAYSNEESSISFVAMAVHELRTPLTIMRGYIEAFQEELGANADPQIQQDLKRMNASAETLTSFVSNILNVARINQGQLSLKLQEDNWNQTLPNLVDNLRGRAAAYGKNIELRMEPEMPTVAVDEVTINEVITNLLDNAIKYSPEDKTDIRIVSRMNKDGLVETTVQDHGVGIPASVMPNLFSKFYRNHRTRAQIGGTGLGLFLCKSIINAHHGNIWASSKEGEGSTFGFTLQPYELLAKDLQTNNNENIVRSSHGWIKNHAMQRR